jgi:HD-like signal output (HDOD) protein
LELLRRVRRDYPGVVRIVLAGYFEMDTALRTAAVAHQFLAKPCAPPEWRDAIERACSLRSLLEDGPMRAAIGALGELPSPPRICMLLMRELQNADASLERLAHLIETDVALSAKLFQLVNSALFSLRQDITSVAAAVGYLGLDVLRQLVLSIEILRVFRPAQPLDGFDIGLFERHAQVTACLAGRLPAGGDAASTMLAALLHDVGQLVLATQLPGRLSAALAQAHSRQVPLHVAEQEMFGATHAAIGAFLLALWGLPAGVVDTVARHHQRLERAAEAGVQSGMLSPLAAVQLADALAHEALSSHGHAQQPEQPVFDPAYLAAAGLGGQLDQWRAQAGEIAARIG